MLSEQQEDKKIRVLVAGCAYGGIAFVVNLLDLCAGKPARGNYEPGQLHPEALKGVDIDVHIVDERDGYFHLIGSPLAFASKSYAPKAWVEFTEVPALQHPSVRFTQGSIIKIDPDRMVAHIKERSSSETSEHSYDYFLGATGLRRVWPVVPQSFTKDEYIKECADHVQSVKNASDGVVVIGGGAVGIEMAAELKVVQPELKVSLIQSRDTLLSAEPLPDDFKQTALDCLREVGVDVILGRGRVAGISTTESHTGAPVQKLTLQDGSHITASHVISAVSHHVPTTGYLPPSCLNEEGLVKIDNLFRFLPDTPHNERQYAIGDMVAWSGIKRCGAAMAMGNRVADTLHQQILYERSRAAPGGGGDFERHLTPWPEVPPMIALAVGRKAVTYDPTSGTNSGEDLMKVYFGDDLGFDACWNHLKLSQPWGVDSPREAA